MKRATKGWFRPLRALCRTMAKTQWRVVGDRHIRAVTLQGSLFHCPLSFTAKAAVNFEVIPARWVEAASALGLPIDLAEQIVIAADMDGRTVVPQTLQMRRILLRAAGLKEASHG